MEALEGPEDGWTDLGGLLVVASLSALPAGASRQDPTRLRCRRGSAAPAEPAAALQKCQLFITLARLLWNNLFLPAAGPSPVGCSPFLRPWDHGLQGEPEQEGLLASNHELPLVFSMGSVMLCRVCAVSAGLGTHGVEPW